MITIPEEFSKQISVFALLFNRKVFKHVKILLMGTLLVIGRRTVCSALRSVGLDQEKHFHKYHCFGTGPPERSNSDFDADIDNLNLPLINHLCAMVAIAA